MTVKQKKRFFEQEVCSLELAKQLRDLKVCQTSYYAWSNIEGDAYDDYEVTDHFSLCQDIDNIIPTRINWSTQADEAEELYYAAYTVAELGELLPPRCRSLRIEDEEEEIWFAKTGAAENVSARANTEADARALLLIYLKRKEYEKTN